MFNECPPLLGTVNDLSGNGNHGKLEGDTHSVPGLYGPALSFDGTGDYVDITDEVIDIADDKTISFWFKSDSISSQQGLVSIRTTAGGVNDQCAIGLYNSKIIASFQWSSSRSYASSALNSDTWYHIVIIKTTGDISGLYVNGIDDNQGGASTYFGLDAVMTHIGHSVYSGGAKYLNGQIDHVMIWDRALSAGEVSQLYAEPFCMFEVDL